jgi:hypothetical protein
MASSLDELKAEGQKVLEIGSNLWVEEAKRLRAKDTSAFALLTASHKYQEFYSKAYNIIKFSTPHQLQEFQALHNAPHKKGVASHTVSDHFSGMGPAIWDRDQAGNTALLMFNRQLSILKAALTILDSAVWNISTELQGALFDNELATASELAKAGHLHAAGALAGVTLERHLDSICIAHKVSLKKTKPTLADYNEALKAAGVCDVIVWRRVQGLADIRNLCVHKGEREPTKDDVNDLISGVTKIVKSLL